MKFFKLLFVVFTIATFFNPAFAHDNGGKGHGNLPPGLQKKVARGGSLPPGWQKKVEVGKPLSVDIYQHHEVVVPIDDRGLLTVRIEGKLIRLIEATREVVEVLD